MRSKITKKLLNYFFLNPQERLFVNELSRKLIVDKRNLVRKLKELEKEGLLKSRKQGNQKIYSINKEYPLYNEYKKIVFKTIGIENKLKDILKNIRGIEKVYLYGSYVKDEMDVHSDIDLLIVGEHKILVVQKEINKLQKEIDREINIVNMDKKEFEDRKKKKDPFINTVFKEKYIEVI
ncbi:MAG: nucleotidyltransferase domain-containing protein [Candidatus Omnitrophota bacterium]